MFFECPECGSSDVDISTNPATLFECQECGCEIGEEDIDFDF